MRTSACACIAALADDVAGFDVIALLHENAVFRKVVVAAEGAVAVIDEDEILLSRSAVSVDEAVFRLHYRAGTRCGYGASNRHLEIVSVGDRLGVSPGTIVALEQQ